MTELRKFIRLAALSLAAFFPWVDYLFRKLRLPGAAFWDDLLIILLLILGLVSGYRKILSVIRRLPVVFAMLFASVALFSFFFNDYLFLAFQHQFRLLLEPFLVFIAVLLLEPDTKEINLYIKMLIASGLMLALHGIYQYVAKVPTPAMWVDKDLERTSIYTRAFSIVGSPNVLASYLELSLPLCLIYFFRIKRLKERILPLVSFAIILVGLLLTFSRGGWIGAFGSTLISFSFFNPIFALLIVLTGTAMIYVVPVLRLRVLSLLDPSYIEKSMESGGRLFRWRYGIMNGIKHPLLGTGLGTFGSSAAQKYGYFSYTSMDSVYINVFAETGFAGLISFVLWIVSGISNALSKYMEKRNLLYLFIAASLISISIHMYVENLFNVWGVTINFWILSAIGYTEDE